ncbi:MAG TPA: O-antigen ligase family protein [Bryobacteraceae bacterium]|nr:O-antigen ligase family protein [Bryobacteraceae bacterium]
MNRGLADALAAALFLGVLTCWAPGFWPVALVEVCALVLLGWVIVTRQIGGAGFALCAMAAVVGWGLGQFAGGVTAYRFETGKAVLYWAANAAIFVAARAACATNLTRNRFLRCILWFGATVSLFVVLEYFTSQGKIFWWFPSGQDRVLGPFLYKNECAAFVELVFPLVVYQSLVDDRDSLVYIGVAATMFAAVITTVSRAGAVLVTGELVVVVLLAWRRGLIPGASLRRWLAWTAVFSVALAAVVGWQVTLEKFREPEPYRVRTELLRSSLAMVAEKPLTGFGLGTWPVVYPAYARFDDGLAANHAHNDWAEWTAEGGVPFVALIALLALWSIRPAVDSLWGIGVPVVFLHSLVDYPLREPALAAVFFAMMGALAARSSKE